MAVYRNAAFAAYAMELNMPDPNENTPGVANVVEKPHPCCNGAPNVRGCDVAVSIPNKTRQQVYQEWISSFDQADNRSKLFRRIRGGVMFNQPGQFLTGTFEARPIEGTVGEVGFTSSVYNNSVGKETIEDIKKDSFVKSSFLTHTNCCKYICADQTGPQLWTCEATFEDDDKASGATKVTLKLRVRPNGCIVCGGEEGCNIPCFVFIPFICLQLSCVLCCTFACMSGMEAQYSSQRALVRFISFFYHFLT